MTPDDPRPHSPDHGAMPPASSLDEQASALVDGQLGEADAAAARRRPEVVARAAEMEAARHALRDVPAAGPEARARAVAAALAAFDDQIRPAGTPPAGPRPVADLGARRRRPIATGRWVGAVAAAVLLLGVLVVGVVSAPSDDAADDFTAALDTGEPARRDADAAEGSAPDAPASEDGGDAEAQADALSPESGARTVGLGAFPTADALLDAAAELPAAQADESASADDSAGAAAADGATRCPGGPADPVEPAGDSTLVATGVVDGLAVEVWRVGPADAGRLVVLDPSCAVLSQRPVR